MSKNKEKMIQGQHCWKKWKWKIVFLTVSESSFVSRRKQYIEIKFIVDSCATNHLVNNTENYLKNKEKLSPKINLVKKEKCYQQ